MEERGREGRLREVKKESGKVGGEGGLKEEGNREQGRRQNNELIRAKKDGSRKGGMRQGKGSSRRD